MNAATLSFFAANSDTLLFILGEIVKERHEECGLITLFRGIIEKYVR
jgi:hypothetical protein